MATPSALAEAVKEALSGGSASASTVTTLHNLLNSEIASQKPGKSADPKVLIRNAKIASAKPAARKRIKEPAVTVREDAPTALPPKAKYGLATDIVNITLKVLTVACKTTAQPKRESPTTQKGVRSPSRKSSVSSRALQSRSGNCTPLSASPVKQTTTRKISVQSTNDGVSEPPPATIATAECARLAFSYLRSITPDGLGAKQPPKGQLETGMLALCARLLALGLQTLAIKELRTVKRRLQSLAPSSKPQAHAGTLDIAEKETLASLLQLDPGIGEHIDVLSLAITYQQLVLKAIIAAGKRAVIEDAVQYLSLDSVSSPANFIKRHGQQIGDTAKAVKQLEALAQTLLALCPNPSAAQDSLATRGTIHSCPTTVFEVQVLALQIRQEWWGLTGHKLDYEKELVQPFSRCLSACARRSAILGRTHQAYTCAEKAYRDLQLSSQVRDMETSCNIYRTMAHLSETDEQWEEALGWTEKMIHRCDTLHCQHARTVACFVKQATLVLKAGLCTSTTDEIEAKLSAIAARLKDQLSGHTADYDLLLADLAQLVRLLTGSRSESSELPSSKHLVHLAAGFAQRYTRSYPCKSIAQTQTILYGALRCSGTSEELQKWVTPDAANIFVQDGSLRSVAVAAASRPLGAAWSESHGSVALGRILRALLLKLAKTGEETVASSAYDDEKLEGIERAAMLEWQLMYALDLADRPKYHAALHRFVPDTLRQLSKLYAGDRYPVRRVRVANIALRIRESHPELLPPHALKVWLDAAPVDRDHLGQDEGLRPFVNDITAGLEVTRAFHTGRPTLISLKPALLVWQRIINEATSVQDLRDRIDDPEVLLQQLKSLASYFDITGDVGARLPVLRLVLKLSQLLSTSGDEQIVVSTDLAHHYLELGFSEKAGHILAQAHKLVVSHNVSRLTNLRLQLAYAEYLLAIDNLDKATETLEEARLLRAELPPDKVNRSERKAYELLHAEGWLVQSKLYRDSGLPHDALAAAKSSVKLLSSAWVAVERSTGNRVPERVANLAEAAELKESDAVTGLTAGVSKLQLTPQDTEHQQEAGKSEKGAVFWSLLPIMCRALLWMSDMYAHHGLFAEADYYSNRAMSLADSTGSNGQLFWVRCRRSRLLVLAGRLEEAELCLAKVDELRQDGNRLAGVEVCCAKAALRAKEGSQEEATQLYQGAVETVDSMQEDGFVLGLERLQSDDEKLAAQTAHRSSATQKDESAESAARYPVAVVTKVGRAPAKRLKATNGRKASKPEKPASAMPAPGLHLLDKVKTKILLERGMIASRSGADMEATMERFGHMRLSFLDSMRQRRVQSKQLMCKAVTALQSDMSYNTLPESTLSFPAMVRADRRPSETGAPRSSLLSSPHKAPSTAPVPAKGGPRKKPAAENVVGLLLAARDCLVGGHAASLRFSSTADTYIECSMLSNVSMLMSAAGLAQAKGALHPVREALHIEQPRNNAVLCETQALLLDEGLSSSPFAWPETAGESGSTPVTAAAFQEKYVDILPEPWTAVSLSLNEDGSELYVVRYRSGQSPIILRLPFSRHKEDDGDEEVFDYHAGKAELQDIIQTSNYSCHNTGSIEAKGAKNNWWSEREALDKRLHELLINIENIWFGGFKGIFAQDPRQPDLLARFRKSIDDILARYLPSRQAAKGRTKPLSLDDKVLELFIGLGTDQDGVVDLDEPLADLLYFVVDMLQFNGERNAYDEVDFDSMAVDVLDALRSYHEACSEDVLDRHLILVLDKRLQAFPWENLPYLQGVSVSRVGSMLSLRQQIITIPQEACHTVSRKSGTFILNPSKDLASTQTTLLAPLSKLVEAEGAKWTSMVQQEPSEDEFRTALSDSTMLLYFGHGSGTQYIRPRSIRKLDRCSEVVWLMGCSSGAVTEYGELEPSAVPLAYLMAGKKYHSGADQMESNTDSDLPEASGDLHSTRCMAVVATLWDVTDKDIDRFSLAVGEEWGLWAPSQAPKLPAKTPKKRDRLATPSTPPQVPRDPKTPKARKTPAPAKTPARSRSRPRQVEARKKSLVEAVAKSRDACYLRYLNGAAAVVYGVPVYLGD